MSFLTTTLAAIFVLGSLIFVHELGHFLAAKWCGVGVLKFSIGFGPTLCKFRRSETDYQLCLIPLGGYVRMVGDDPDPVPGNEAEIPEGQLSPEAKLALSDRGRWFSLKSLPQRTLIVAAGPLMNFVFAALIVFASTLFYGELSVDESNLIGDVMPGSPAEQAGIQPGDKLLAVNGKTVSKWEELAKAINHSASAEVRLQVERNSEQSEVVARAEKKEISLRGKKESVYLVGIQPKTERVEASFARSLSIAGIWTAHATIQTYRGIFGLITGNVSPKELAGPIGIIQAAGKQAKRGFEYLLSLTAILSISLAVLNLLPIPVLDGGHLLFFAIEAAAGPLSVRKREVATHLGLVLLFGLMIFAVYNDLTRKSFDDSSQKVKWGTSAK